jgi:hypothetical protein
MAFVVAMTFGSSVAGPLVVAQALLHNLLGPDVGQRQRNNDNFEGNDDT